jgi:hypothetical protein
MSRALISSILAQRLAAFTPVMPIAWENTTFKPTVGVPWLKPTLMIGSARPATLGRNRYVLHQGIFQIDVVFPAASEAVQGAGNLNRRADELTAWFPPGLNLFSGAVRVTVEYAETARATEQPDWFSVPLSVGWFAHTQ